MEPLTKLNPVFYTEISDESTGLKGCVVIDKNLNGIATGGIRMTENLTLEEVANLAYEMTLKFAFLNIKKDGAKAGICAPARLSEDKKKELCSAFGKAISRLVKEGKYYPGEDLGINSQDLARILSGAGVNGKAKEGEIKSEYFTALTVFLTTVEILRSNNQSIENQTVIVEGFGKVGKEAAKMFAENNAKVIGISTCIGALYDERGLDINELCGLKERYGDNLVNYYQGADKIEKEKLLLQKADILIPGARPDSINNNNIDKIKAKLIVPIANIAATEEIENKLFARKITFIPGFVSNCGGILAYFLSEQGFKNDGIEAIIKNGFPKKIRKAFNDSKSKTTAFSKIAREIAATNIRTMEYENRLPLIKKLNIQKAAWLSYEALSKIRYGFILNNFARQYISAKLFS